MIILTCIIVYILSAYLLWLHEHLSHSEGGIYYPTHLPESVDIVLVFIPIINTILAIVSWGFDYPIEVKTNIVRKFFKL